MVLRVTKKVNRVKPLLLCALSFNTNTDHYLNSVPREQIKMKRILTTTVSGQHWSEYFVACYLERLGYHPHVWYFVRDVTDLVTNRISCISSSNS